MIVVGSMIGSDIFIASAESARLIGAPRWLLITFVSSRRRHTRYWRDWSSDVCSSDLARDAGVNLLRVWGGGIYESEDFYDTCDRLGILTWQDFLFACAAYGEEEPLRGEVVAEAREAVTRLTPHPSLVLWNGCNENLWGREDWGWREQLNGRTWGAGYYLDVLPGIVAELDPTRPYWPGSPWSGSTGRHPNLPEHG